MYTVGLANIHLGGSVRKGLGLNTAGKPKYGTEACLCSELAPHTIQMQLLPPTGLWLEVSGLLEVQCDEKTFCK